MSPETTRSANRNSIALQDLRLERHAIFQVHTDTARWIDVASLKVHYESLPLETITSRLCSGSVPISGRIRGPHTDTGREIRRVPQESVIPLLCESHSQMCDGSAGISGLESNPMLLGKAFSV